MPGGYHDIFFWFIGISWQCVVLRTQLGGPSFWSVISDPALVRSLAKGREKGREK
jgi:hypothetical protein